MGLGDRGCLTDLLLTNYRIMQVLPANKMLDTLKYDIKLHPIKITRITIHIALLAQIVGANIMLIEQITPKLIPMAQVFQEKLFILSKDSELEKYLHGKTQNGNESFNGLIWERIPKTTSVTLLNLDFGVYDAVANFNIGMKKLQY